MAEFSRVVAQIHAAPQRPEAWQVALADLTDCLEATSCSLAVATPADTSAASATTPGEQGTRSGLTILATTISPEAATTYQAYYHQLDFVVGDCERSPIGLVRSGFDLVANHRHTEFHADWQRRFDMADGLHVRLAGPTPTSFLVSAAPRPQPYANTERIRFLDALIPHLHHALAARRELLAAQQPAADPTALDLRAVSEMTGHGLVIVGPGGRIMTMNPAAHRILDRGDGLRVRGQRLRAGLSAVDDDLGACLAAALGGQPRSVLRLGGHVVCPRPSGARPYLLRILPLDTEHDPRAGRAAVIIVDPDHQPTPPKELLRSMFGLTATETKVALRLLDGTGIPTIATDLALSVATIKTHAHKVFTKTNTHRQAELVRLLTTFTQ